MIFGPKKIKAFGLDISESSIRVMQLDRSHDGFAPTAHCDFDLPNTLISNHMVSDEQKLADFITRALKAAKNINTRYVVASVPEAKSFVRILKMPKMPESEIGNAIPWELEQDIPIPIELVYLDWRVVKEEGENIFVLVMATPKDYVDALVGAIKLAKLRPVALELESQAIARALVGKADLNQATLLVDMSSTVTSFITVSGANILEYTSNIPIGGNQITESISRNLGVTPKEAEKVKLENGLLADSKKGNVRQAMLPILDNIVDEIRNVVNFHDAHSVMSPAINKIILSGGAANLKGLVDYVTARMNVGAGRPIDRIVLGNAWANTQQDEKLSKQKLAIDDALGYATAIGLALRGMNP